MPPTLSDLLYEERLKKLNLPSLEERGNLIVLYQILLGYEKLDQSDLLVRDLKSTRGHERVKKGVCRRDIKKNSFLQRITGIWNELQN